jgi:DNA-binding transcriptional MerR regulator
VADRSYLSIGQVLDLLKREFPDLTISKIRFLESQGLLDPERTPSGYRKFYEPDVERLRFILRAQHDQYLPLKVIRGRLGGETADDEAQDGAVAADHVADAQPAAVGAAPRSGGASGSAGGVAGAAAAGSARSGSAAERLATPAAGGTRGQTAHPSGPRNGGDTGSDDAGVAAGGAAGAGPGPASGSGSASASGSGSASASGSGSGSASGGGAAPGGSGGAGGRTRGGDTAARGADGATRAGQGPLSPRLELVPTAEVGVAPDPISVTIEELAEASGLSLAEVTELERFGLLAGRRVAGAVYYDGDCLEIALLAATFRGFGVEARHLRMYRTAVEREAGFFEQVVTPMLKQRNPQARVQAVETLLELSRLGHRMRAAVLRQALRDYTGGP